MKGFSAKKQETFAADILVNRAWKSIGLAEQMIRQSDRIPLRWDLVSVSVRKAHLCEAAIRRLGFTVEILRERIEKLRDACEAAGYPEA